MAHLLGGEALHLEFPTKIVFDSVSLGVDEGDRIGIVGRNGDGKSSLLAMLAGRLDPDSGRVTVRGGVRVGVLDQGDTLVAALPLGLRRQLAFLCALQHTPAVLVLDEPSSGVGPLARTRLWDRIREEAVRGAGVLVTTHYMQEARQCDRLLLMSDGRLVATGTEADIVDGTHTVAVTAPDWSRAFEVLAGAGFMVTLAGRAVRVVDPDNARLRAALAEAGLDATLTDVVPTIEERMTALARS